ncbi:MAG: Peroxide stress regulator; Ferric uptake regulation protein; Fe2+/Zn2+ uptake regulation proteins [uncultured Thermomicrobiales bacterium]|jgi:Fur family ferric uptake transcriptional regulator|uniref:Peroxide stress regulator Ferric uptake regulation protein Fe2+/Zn2+ uptake regulation proteins n=1 Tax=uncultured Thermomicrobiales bacterium TaxID=1645740 RepID=A0A6J4UMK0_9BACT|nr:MAG: Peroxide stress regulator; Ferric uptake regulation protein; Fe2+/Zn2+ uptake regulation proteins [uncultured Thermomicrobiales bacterium]
MIRQTKPREIIIKTIERAEGPVAVEEIHARAAGELPGLGIATVYRTLKLLLAQERIAVVEFPGEPPHYEPAGRGHHHHFRCLSCNRWMEMGERGCIVPWLDGSILPGGYLVEGHRISLYGRCPNCADEVAPPG